MLTIGTMLASQDFQEDANSLSWARDEARMKCYFIIKHA